MSAAKRLATLGCVSLLASTTACGSSAPAVGADGAPKTTISMGTVESFSSLDPAGAYDYGSWLLYYNIYQGLMSYQPGATEPTPDAAQKCGFADAGDTTYTCTLRSGLKFSNGDPLNAAAVKFSFDRVVEIGKLGHDNGSGVSTLLSTLTSVTTDGDLGVTFHLNTADATFPDRLASGVGEIVDPKVYPSNNLLQGTGVVGSGVYKVDSVQYGKPANGKPNPQSVTMSLNPSYQGAAISSGNKPGNSGIVMKYYPDAAGVMSALNSGAIDLNANNDLTAADLVRLEAGQQLGTGLQVNTGAGTQTRMMILNTKYGPFSNQHARQAVAELVNRTAIANNVYQRTVVPLYSVIPAGIGDATAAYADKYTSEPTAPAVVKSQLLNEGMKLPISFTYQYAADSGGADAEAALIKTELETDGIFKVTLHPLTNLTALSAQWTNGNVEASVVGWSSDYPDPDDYVSPFISAPGTAGTFGSYYSDPLITNTWTPVTLKQTDRGSAAAMDAFKKIQYQIAVDAAYVPLWQNKQYVVTQADITGVPLTLDTAGIMRFWMIGKS